MSEQTIGRKTRFTADFEPEFDRLLADLARRRNTPKVDIIRRAVALYNFLIDNTTLVPEGAATIPGLKVSITDRNDRVLKDVPIP